MAVWMCVSGPENFQRTKENGFKIQGFKTRQRRKVLEQMRPGDTLVSYISGAQKLGAIAELTSEGFEDHDLIWSSPKKPDED